MSFPEAEMLLKDPTRLLQLLYSKYGYIDEDVEQLYINQILYNKKSHYDTLYKEYQYNDILEEFLRRFYTTNEATPRIPKLANYYKNYHLFFCKPVLRDWRVHLMMSKYGDNKAEVFYKDNYGADTEMRNELEQNIESSLSEASLRGNNGKVNKTIFDKVTRKFIDNNNNNVYKHKVNDNKQKQMKCNQVNNNNSITLNLINDSKLNQTYGLISKRSNNNSFLDLMHSLNICNKIPSSMRNSLPNKNKANRSNSINNHLKQKVIKKNTTNTNVNTTKQTGNDMNNANNVNNKNTFNPPIKMNFNNIANKTKFAEFKQNNPMNNNNNNNTTHSKKNSHINASSNTHYNIISSSHHKNKSYQQNSIGACNSINNLFHYKSSRLTRNNTKQLGYNLSLKKSNPISNLHSLSNNNNNNSKGRNTKLNLIKSPQHSSVTTYYNMIFNMTHNTQTQKMKSDMKHNTKTFVVQKSQRSSSYKGNTNNNSIENKNSRNKRMFSQNASKTSTQSIKTFNKTRNIFTRSVENQKTKVNGVNKISNNQRQINAVIGLLNKQNGYDDKKNTFNQHFHFLHNKQQYVNNNNNTKVQELKNKLNHKSTNNNNTKGKIMFQTLNGFNIGLNRRLKAGQSKNKKI